MVPHPHNTIQHLLSTVTTMVLWLTFQNVGLNAVGSDAWAVLMKAFYVGPLEKVTEKHSGT